MNSMQYSDNICEAIDIIAKNVVKGLNFDQTILCTITDDSQAKKGEYLVTDGSSIYNVISNNHTYKAGTQVYVLIPKGDYSQQKIIVSEYSIEKEQDEDNKGYIKPIDTIIPVEEIEIEFDNNIEELELIANSAQALGQGSATPDINRSLELETQYTRLSVEASFKTGFDQDIISGDYSLVFFLSGTLMNGAEVERKQYLFNCDRFFGNPYRFDTEVSQSIVFDISDFKELKKIEIRFQESGNFYAEGNEFLQYEEGKKLANLFVKNIKLILGFGIEEYQNNDLILTSKDSLEYNHEKEKSLQLNQIRKRNNNTMFSINSLDDINEDNYKYLTELKDAGYLSIYWYKYLLTPIGIQDPYTKDYFYSIEKSYNNTIYNDDAIKGKFEDGENPFTFSFKTNTTGRAFERIKSAIAITGCLRKKILKTQFITINGETIEATVLKKKERPFYILEDDWIKELEKDWSKEYELDYDYVYYDPLDEIDPNTLINSNDDISQYYWNEEANSYVLYTEETKKKEETERVRQYEQRELSMSTRFPNGEIEINRDLETNIIVYNEVSSFIYLSDNEHAVRSDEYAYYITNESGSEDEYYELVGQNYQGEKDLKQVKAYDLKLVPTTFLLSNPVTFENNFTEVIDLGNVNLIDKLELECLDELKGKYFIYGEDNTIPASVANNTQRYIQTTFNFINSKDVISDPVEIQWKIPANRTMIADPLPDTPYSGLMMGPKKEEEITGSIKWDDLNTTKDFWIGKIILSDRTESYKLEDEGVYSISIKIPYQIKSYYSPSLVNNTIQCIVSKPLESKTPIENKSEYELRFGPAGMNGTNYVFMLNLGPAYERIETEDAAVSSSLGVAVLGDSVLNVNGYLYQVKDPQRRSFIKQTDTDTYIFVEPSLYDGKNLLLEDLDLKEISWSWYNSSNKYTSSQSTIDFIDIDDKCYLKSTYDETSNPYQAEDHCAILQADIIYNNIKLTAYLPIPMAFNADINITGVELADKIIYNSDGVNPTYYKNPSKLFINNSEEENISNVIFVNRVRLDNSDNDGQYPLFKSDSPCAITVPPIYYKNQEKDLVSISLIDNETNESLFIQPILIIQNRFGNAMLNEWDGSLVIDKENNRILSAQVAAGEKNSDNSFSGILMGAVGKNSLDNSTTKYGLYGYRYGALSFGFKEDGTAFIGNSGSGRIEFNGNQGLIQSSNYINNGIGMSINLLTGKLTARNAGGSVYIAPDVEKNLFLIRDKNEKDLINIGNGESYLQSGNYEAKGYGFKLSFNKNEFSLMGDTTDYDSDIAQIRFSNIDPYFQISQKEYSELKNIKCSKTVDDDQYSFNYDESSNEKYDFYMHQNGTRLVLKNKNTGEIYISVRTDLSTKDLVYERIKLEDTTGGNNRYAFLWDYIIQNNQLSKLKFKKETSSAWQYDETKDLIVYNNSVNFYLLNYSRGGVKNEGSIYKNGYKGWDLNCLTYHTKSNSIFAAIGTDSDSESKLGRYIFNSETNDWSAATIYIIDTNENRIQEKNFYQIAIQKEEDVLFAVNSSYIYKIDLSDFDSTKKSLILDSEKYVCNDIVFFNKSYYDNNNKYLDHYFTYQGMAVDDKYFYFPVMKTNGNKDFYEIQGIDVRNKNDGKEVIINTNPDSSSNSSYLETIIDENGNPIKTWNFISITGASHGEEIEDISFASSYMLISFAKIKGNGDRGRLAKVYRIEFDNNHLPEEINLARDATAVWAIIEQPTYNHNGVAQGFTVYPYAYTVDNVVKNSYMLVNAFSDKSANNQSITLTPYHNLKTMVERKNKDLIIISNDKFLLQSYNYKSKVSGAALNLQTGEFFCNNINARGTIYADNGKVGGWTIGSSPLSTKLEAIFHQIRNSKNQITHQVGMQSGSGATGTSLAFFVKALNSTKTALENKFYVNYNGTFYAKDAIIEGDLNAGTVGGWIIGPSPASSNLKAISYTLKDKNDKPTNQVGMQVGTSEGHLAFFVKALNSTKTTLEDKFYVKCNGKLYAKDAEIEGKIIATAGEIGGCKIESGVLQIGSANIGDLDVTGNIDTGSLTIDGKQITASTITATQIKDGTITADEIASGAITAGKIASGAITADKIDANFLSANVITSGELNYTVLGNKDNFNATGPNDYLGSTIVFNQSPKYGAIGFLASGSISGSAKQISFVVTNSGTLGGSWNFPSGASTAAAFSVDSDFNKKNTINLISETYDEFFDLLKPVTYKYNNGTSNRLHTGFIAQQVEQSLLDSNISSYDFAGFIKEISEENGNININYYLRYDEFVALNTWQIQKLKTRVLELENKILELEAKL